MQGAVVSSNIPNPQVPPEWRRQTIEAAPCLLAPKIDGVLNDACWASAAHIAGFYMEEGTAPVDAQTEAWVCADKTHLYIAFHCIDNHPEQIKAQEVRRNGSVFVDDYVQISIDSQNTRHNYSTFVVTARGTQRDAIEGGTPSNITWVGDWKAATIRTHDGWTCEISIPFGLLRYPHNARSFGLLLVRKLARETTREIWPYIPTNGLSNEADYFSEMTGLNLPTYKAKPVILPYVLASTGSGSSIHEGVDVKYPLTTTLTGAATLYPDFQTVEENVVGINFTYDAKYIQDRRPFFAEGANYFPYSDIFYSTSISQVDAGLKVTGKQGNTGIGLLTTDDWDSGNEQTTQVLALHEDIGLLSRLELDYAADNQVGVLSNRVGKLEGLYGWKVGSDIMSVIGNMAPSWQGGLREDRKDYAGFSVSAPDGKPNFYLNYDNIGPNFISDLGYVPEVNIRGVSMGTEQSNRFMDGPIESYAIGFDSTDYRYYTGGFYYNSLAPYISLRTRHGLGITVTPSIGQRDDFHDHTNTVVLSWGRKTLYQRGSLGYTAGDMEGSTYKYLTFSQGVLANKTFTTTTNYSVANLGTLRQTQAVLNATHLITAERSVSLRVVQQTGEELEAGDTPDGTNIFVAYAQQPRSGSDVYLLLGDPNSANTRGIVSLKIVTPF